MFKKVEVRVKKDMVWYHLTTMKIAFWKNGVTEFKNRYKMAKDWITKSIEIEDFHNCDISVETKGYGF